MGTLKSFKQFSEEKKKEVVFTFGRFNPPTIGHGKLLAKVAAAAIGNDYRIYASQSSDPKKNPLEYKEKIKVMRKMFPNHGRNIVEDKNAKTALHIASILHDQGFTKLTMVVGSDRIKEFQKLLNTYNGAKGRHGFYDFKDGIDVVSAGERDPDAEGVSGMSASKMRQAAIDGDFKSFMLGIPKAYGKGMTLFNLLRKRMGLKEKKNFREHVELPTVSETRERYIAGEVFNEGDTAYVGEVSIVIQERKSNYVVCTEGDKYFISSLSEKLNKTYGKGLSKSTKAKRQAQFNKQAKLDDDDPKAYKPAPGDARSKTKLSKHTIAYRKKFGEFVEIGKAADDHKKNTPGKLNEKQIAGLKKKAEKSGISYGILKQVFNRGMAAWKTGHRPGATPHQWAFARVNSFITKSKGTWGGADKDLAAKVRKESVDEGTGKSEPEDIEEAKKVIAQVELWNGKKMKKSFKNQSSAEKFIKKMQDQEDVRGYNMYAEGLEEGEGKSEPWEDGFKRRVVKTTKPEHLEKGFKWRIKGKDRNEISIKLYKKKPDFNEYKKQMKRVAGHEFGG